MVDVVLQLEQEGFFCFLENRECGGGGALQQQNNLKIFVKTCQQEHRLDLDDIPHF
jgi:hypothetical protein